MNKYIVILVLLLVGSMAVIYTSGNKVSQDTMVEEQTTDTQDNNAGNTAPNDAKSSQYVPYTSGVLDTVQQPRRVLFFYASWCPTCRPADKSFQENVASLPEDVVVIRVNYNDPETDQEEKDLAKKYEVGYQHTFVQIDAQGNKIKLWNGGGFEELLQNLK